MKSQRRSERGQGSLSATPQGLALTACANKGTTIIIGLEENMNVFHLLGERRFFKNRFITAYL